MSYKRKPSLVHGVGINDADYAVVFRYDGGFVRCPFYIKWVNMISRCYGKRTSELQPTYNTCKVCEDWKKFTVFKEWMQTQDWEGKHLDKDLLHQGNKYYSPEKCIFVTREVNNLISQHSPSINGLPVGVRSVPSGNFVAYCRVDGVSVHIGTYATFIEASNQYLIFKRGQFNKVAYKNTGVVRDALLRYKI